MLGGEGEGFRSIMYATHDDCWHLCVAFTVLRVTLVAGNSLGQQ